MTIQLNGLDISEATKEIVTENTDNSFTVSMSYSLVGKVDEDGQTLDCTAVVYNISSQANVLYNNTLNHVVNVLGAIAPTSTTIQVGTILNNCTDGGWSE